MKKIVLSAAAILAATVLTTSCASLGNAGAASSTSSSSSSASSSSSDSGQSLLGSLLGGLVGEAIPLSDRAIQGTWSYASPECRFKSENALASAGGAVAANTIENKLAEIYAKVGIKKGVCSFTFNEDKTCEIKYGNKTLKGTWTLDAKNRDLVIKAGLLTLNAKAYYSVKELTLLFESDKILSVIKVLGSIAGGLSSTVGSLTQILDNYDGLLLGFNLSK
ncbi:MAG: DUF4923 family protein [Muribaculaceae bacterium]|nr:DUF4923 family protein [Muribaculaceae bacterium]